MANFIALNSNIFELTSRFVEIKNNNINDDRILQDMENGFGSLPYFGSITALFNNTPELKNFKTRIYENFSRHGLSTLYIPELDILIVKLPEKATVSRAKPGNE